MSQTSRTWCRNCPSLCGLLVEVDNNKVLSIRGDKESPLSEGYFCPKGLASLDLHNGEDRLRSSLARDSHGALSPIPSERALDEIHARLDAILKRYGPRAVAMYYGTGINNHSLGHAAMKGWLNLVGSPYMFSSMTVDQSAKWVALGRLGMFLTGKHDVLSADVLMAVGSNAAISHVSSYPISNPRNWMRAQKKRGLKLIVVDPRKTETAQLADIHLQIRPGEDASLFAGLIRLVMQNEEHDRQFCGRFLGSFAELKKAVAPFTLEYTAERTGIDQQLIIQAKDLFVSGVRKSAFTGTGPDMGPNSNVTEHLVEAFNAICGGYRKAGDWINNTGPLYGGAATQELVFGPTRPWLMGPKCRTADIGPMYGEFPSGLLADEIRGKEEDRIRALFVVGGNPAKAIGDPTKTISALRSLELMVTQDFRPTETTDISHYVLATSLPYERHDFTGIYDPMLSIPFAHAGRPIIERRDDILDDWEIFWGLAKRMGRPLALKRPMFGAPHDQIPGPELVLELDRKPDTEDIIRWMTSQGSTDYETLLAHPQGTVVESCRAQVTPAGPDDGARLDLCAPDVAEEIEGVYRRNETLALADYPFRLIVRRMLESMNTAYQNASKTRRRHPVNPAFMNPDDMEMLNLSEGDAIDITSPYGTVVAFPKQDTGLRRGVVSVTHGWGSIDSSADPSGNEGAFTGRLVSLTHDRQTINWMPRQSAIPVRICLRSASVSDGRPG